jgi:hypothetical protein
MKQYLEIEKQKCTELFAVCYAQNAPVPPDWITYYDNLEYCQECVIHGIDFKLPEKPESKKYPCDWCPAWEGWMALSKLDLARSVMCYIKTLPNEEQVLARIEIEKSRFWFRTNSYFIKMTEMFKWTEAQIDYFFTIANNINKNA